MYTIFLSALRIVVAFSFVSFNMLKAPKNFAGNMKFKILGYFTMDISNKSMTGKDVIFNLYDEQCIENSVYSSKTLPLFMTMNPDNGSMDSYKLLEIGSREVEYYSKHDFI